MDTVCGNCKFYREEKAFHEEPYDQIFSGRCTEPNIQRPPDQSSSGLPRTKEHYWCARSEPNE